ncbi:MAG: VOC family protein [Clostridia bacterium]|nr:VOC family protein [Clostridia bacterium]
MKTFLNAVHHVAIIVSDYQRARRFYVDTLGFQVIRENYRPQRDDWKLDLRLGDMELEIFGMANAPKRPSYPEACGLRHLAFRVENVEPVVSWLQSRGVACEPIRVDEYTGKRMTFFHDPDGLPLELHE